MDIVCLDAETFFTDEYSLKKLTTEEYVRDERFECHGWAVRTTTGRTWWLTDQQARKSFSDWNWANTCLVAHHAHFDGLILSHHYGIKPAFWIDTLSMGRVVIGPEVSLSLASLAGHFELSPKDVPYDLFRGKHWHELAPGAQMQVAEGACHDVDLTWQLAGYMMAGGHPAVPYPIPPQELRIIDATIRMFVEPTLVGDVDALRQVWDYEEQAKEELLAELGVTAKDLGSDAVLAQLLVNEGVELVTKTTAKGNEKYPFAKTDGFMRELLESDDERVALLAEARLRVKSNIDQTRSSRLGWMATRGPMCVYLAYGAAHTRRWGGGDKLNWQNLPRADPAKPRKGALRRAIKAPRGDKPGLANEQNARPKEETK